MMAAVSLFLLFIVAAFPSATLGLKCYVKTLDTEQSLEECPPASSNGTTLYKCLTQVCVPFFADVEPARFWKGCSASPFDNPCNVDGCNHARDFTRRIPVVCDLCDSDGCNLAGAACGGAKANTLLLLVAMVFTALGIKLIVFVGIL